jgi:hypothetical protein
MSASGFEFQSSYFQIKISDEGLKNILSFILAVMAVGARLQTGSLIAVVPTGADISKCLLPGIQLQPIGELPTNSDELNEDIMTWDPRLIKELSEQNDRDHADVHAFKAMFERTFELTSNGTLTTSREHLVEGQRLFFRYRTLVQSHTGIMLQIPTLCFKYSSDPSKRMQQLNKNKNVMFGLFVAVYGAYFQICRNMGFPNKYANSLNMEGGIVVYDE